MKFHHFLTWTPRVLAIAFVLFISLFSLDAFSGSAPLSEKLLGFAIHLIPSFAFAGLTYVAWKRPKIGGIVFLLLSFFTVLAFDTYEQWQSLLTITGVPLLTGILFLVSSKNPNH